jgi:hypothetical protein
MLDRKLAINSFLIYLVYTIFINTILYLINFSNSLIVFGGIDLGLLISISIIYFRSNQRIYQKVISLIVNYFTSIIGLILGNLFSLIIVYFRYKQSSVSYYIDDLYFMLLLVTFFNIIIFSITYWVLYFLTKRVKS